MRRPGIGVTALALTVAMITVACGRSANIDNTSRDPRTGSITKSGDIGTQRLRYGDCFNDPSGSTTVVVRGVPCLRAHQSQVAALLELPDDPAAEWPGAGSLGDRSRSLCFGAAADALGGSLTDPTVGLSAYVPDQKSWEAGDRRIVCVLGRFDGSPLTGSLFDSST